MSLLGDLSTALRDSFRRGPARYLVDWLAEQVALSEAGTQKIHDVAGAFLDNPRCGRALIARMARSEVKSYLQELAEGADMPFRGPDSFLAAIREHLATTASTSLRRDPDEPYDPASDSPFEILGQLTLHPFPELDDRGQD